MRNTISKLVSNFTYHNYPHIFLNVKNSKLAVQNVLKNKNYNFKINKNPVKTITQFKRNRKDMPI